MAAVPWPSLLASIAIALQASNRRRADQSSDDDSYASRSHHHMHLGVIITESHYAFTPPPPTPSYTLCGTHARCCARSVAQTTGPGGLGPCPQIWGQHWPSPGLASACGAAAWGGACTTVGAAVVQLGIVVQLVPARKAVRSVGAEELWHGRAIEGAWLPTWSARPQCTTLLVTKTLIDLDRLLVRSPSPSLAGAIGFT